MSNVINFPICRGHKEQHWYGGRGFDTKQQVIDSMSDRDWLRIGPPYGSHRAPGGGEEGMSEKELRELAAALERAHRIVTEALARLDGEAAVMPSRIDPRIASLEAIEAKRNVTATFRERSQSA
jgi:hypothetical protein